MHAVQLWLATDEGRTLQPLAAALAERYVVLGFVDVALLESARIGAPVARGPALLNPESLD
jgi:hypothetical protein